MRRLALLASLLLVAAGTGTAAGSVDQTPRSVVERALLKVKPAPDVTQIARPVRGNRVRVIMELEDPPLAAATYARGLAGLGVRQRLNFRSAFSRSYLSNLEAQQTQAILPYQVSDLVLGPGEDGKTIQPEGIKASALNAAQQQMLLDLAHEWIGILNDEAAAAKMADNKAHLPETWFAWSGPTTNGSAAYFRIQGPTLLIEYAPQRLRGSGGLDTNHIHTIYRDPTNDYGARLVKR